MRSNSPTPSIFLSRLALLGTITALTSCGCQIRLSDFGTGTQVKGNGVLVTEERLIDDYDSIEVQGVIQVEVSPGLEPSLTITGEENLLAILNTKTADGALVIGASEPYSSTKPIVIKTTCPNLIRYTGHGVTQATITGLESDRFEAQLNGASTLLIQTGNVELFKADISGVSNLNAKGLRANKADVQASGTSHITLNVTEDLNAQASGASNIVYHGNPNSNQINTSGVATIRPVKK